MERWISLLGLFVMIALAWLLSAHKRRICWRVVAGGLALQFAFAFLILRTEPGRLFFAAAGDVFTAFLDSVDKGSEFVFGPKFRDHFFAFKILPTIIFFSACTSILYYLGVMQVLVRGVGSLVQRTLGTTGPESLAAAANIFLGQTEAPLAVRPYIAGMTRSELMAIMVPGFGSTAGGVLAAYVGMGIDPGHLIAASVMSAPAGLLIAKVLEPETERPLDIRQVDLARDPAIGGGNLIEAAARGATEGLKLALNVGAMLIAFLALIALVDQGLHWVGQRMFGQAAGVWSLSAGVGYLFAPLAWVMGMDPADCWRAGELLGIRLVANEFIAYERLAAWLREGSGVQLTHRSQIILTYALCGFANFGSIGVQIGGIGAMAPNQHAMLSRLGVRAMLGGMLACFMTACIAGILLD